MSATLTLDKAGRVVIPKPMRDRLGLASGDSLRIEALGDALVLSPVRDEPTMLRKDGMWLIKPGKAMTVEDFDAMVEAVRDERHRQILGSWPK